MELTEDQLKRIYAEMAIGRYGDVRDVVDAALASLEKQRESVQQIVDEVMQPVEDAPLSESQLKELRSRMKDAGKGLSTPLDMEAIKTSARRRLSKLKT